MFLTEIQTYQETAGKPLNVRSGLSAYTKSLPSLTNITKIEKISPYNLRFHVLGSHGFKQGSSIVIENVANKEIRVVNSLKKTKAAELCFEGIKVLSRSSSTLTINISFCPNRFISENVAWLFCQNMTYQAPHIFSGLKSSDLSTERYSNISKNTIHIIHNLTNGSIYTIACAISLGNSKFKRTLGEQVFIPHSGSVFNVVKIRKLTTKVIEIEAAFPTGSTRCVVVSSGTSGVTGRKCLKWQCPKLNKLID